MAKKWFVSADCDDAGKRIGKAVLANDPESLKNVSELITAGVAVIDKWGRSWKGTLYSSGGDQNVWMVPKEALEELEQVKKEVKDISGFSCTFGVADTLANSGRALVYGKMTGKNKIVTYDISLEEEIEAAQKRDENGTASAEEHKMNNDYLKKSMLKHKHSLQKEQKDEDVISNPPETECQYCAELATGYPEAEHEAESDHCRWCHDETPAQDEDDCQYCSNVAVDPQAENATTAPPVGDDHDDCPYCQEEQNAANTEGIETEDNNPQQTVDDATSQMDDPADLGNVADQALGTDKEGLATEENVSRPDDYATDTPSDLGLNEEEAQENNPDFSEVIRGGLDNHAQNIQKEKVNQLVGTALEGFKNSSHILERAKDQAPELYQSTLAMLKAMIALCKMVGLHPEDAQPEQQEQGPDKEQPPVPAKQASKQEQKPDPK